MSDLAVITVTHNSSHLIDGFMERLLAGYIEEAHRLIVVDSGSIDVAVTKLAAERRGATFVASPNNIGYGSGSNRGVKETNATWLAFVNPDVQVNFGDLLKLAGDAEEHHVQCIGPNVMNEDGDLVVTWHPIAAPPWRRKETRATREGEVFHTRSVSGCCMLVRRSWFEALDGFDEDFFMFCEEIDLHKRLSDLGGKTAVSNRVAVITPGGSSSKGTSKRWSMTERSVAHVQFVAKHYSLAEAAIDALWRSAIIVFSPKYSPRRASLSQLARGIRRAIAQQVEP